ncbi:hypothetical protein LIA77_05472 [Sarocladium implicatum]|nr:hypothetical protein LIA77_05472 [Sarocladium implicatum]
MRVSRFQCIIRGLKAEGPPPWPAQATALCWSVVSQQHCQAPGSNHRQQLQCSGRHRRCYRAIASRPPSILGRSKPIKATRATATVTVTHHHGPLPSIRFMATLVSSPPTRFSSAEPLSVGHLFPPPLLPFPSISRSGFFSC